ncbi:hypothetical protein ACFIOY_18800 [Bradyrhizobium sp. TZ2]
MKLNTSRELFRFKAATNFIGWMNVRKTTLLFSDSALVAHTLEGSAPTLATARSSITPAPLALS